MRYRLQQVVRLAALGLASLTVVALAQTSIQVSPTLLDFSPAENAQGLQLTNTGSISVRLQMRLLEWRQQAQSDALTPTRDIVASPPVVELAPGQQQLVRIVRVLPQPSKTEQAYRLLVDELPATLQAQPTSEGASDKPASGAGLSGALKFNLRHSIPVFVAPENQVPLRNQPGATSQVTAQVTLDASGRLTLTVLNEGSRRARLSQLKLTTATGQTTDIVSGLLGYALSGQRMQWPLNLSTELLAPGTLLTAKINDQVQAQTLFVVPAR